MTDPAAQGDREVRVWSNPGLGQAGTALLLVGWILGITMVGVALVVLLFVLLWRLVWGHFSTWGMGHLPDGSFGPPWFSGSWGIFGWLTVGLAVLSLVGVVVATVLVFCAWRAVGRGERRYGGIFAVVGGALMLLFAGMLGAVPLVGGILVLVASGDGGEGASTDASDPPPAPVAGQYPPPPPR